MSASLGERAARSSAYLLIRRLVSYGVRFSAIAILSRKLSVGEFGLVAIATTCINIMVVFGAAGINSWVIYDRAEGWESRARSAWWLNTVLTSGQVLVAGASVPLVIWIYDDPALAPVLAVLISTFFIEQMSLVPNAIIERHLDFRRAVLRDMSYDILTGIGGVAMAIAGAGVWSLVVPRLVLSPIFVVVSMTLAKWTPGTDLGRRDWKRIFKYTLPLIGGSILHVVTNDGDTLLVGRLLGKVVVGFYNTAYVLANLIGRNVTAVVVQVSMPTIAKMREATDVIGPACIRMYRMIALVTTPMLAGMFAIAGDLILLVLGPKWTAVLPLLRLFILFTVVRSITSPSGSIFNVLGRTGLSFKFYIGLTPGIFAAVIIGQHFGVAGVALGVTLVRIVAGFTAFAVSLKIVNAKVMDGFLALVPSTVASVVMGASVWATQRAIEDTLMLGARIALLTPLGAVLYLVLLRVISRAAFVDLLKTASMITPKLKRILRPFTQERVA